MSNREGINAIAEPGECRNVSSVALKFVAAFQTFIRASKLPVWNKTDNTGFWRMLTVSYLHTLVSIILVSIDKIPDVRMRCSCLQEFYGRSEIACMTVAANVLRNLLFCHLKNSLYHVL